MKILKFAAFAVLFSSIIACDSAATAESNEGDSSEQLVNLQEINLDNLIEEIEKRENAIEKSETVSTELKIELLESYLAYANRFPNYKNADEYLFKGARLSSEVGRTVDAIRYFDKLYNEFPDYEDRPLALFMKAFVLENNAGNLVEAKTSYELFLRDHPTHDMSDDARISIENLGKSPEEIIRGFEIKDSIANANQKAA